MFTLELDEVLYDLPEISQLSLESFTPYQRRALTFCKAYIDGQETFQMYTSGSTGEPKSIALSRNQMQASAQATIQALELKSHHQLLTCISTDFIGGKMMLVRGIELAARVKLVEPSATLEDLQPPDFVALVPLQVYSLLQSTAGRSFLAQSAQVIIGGAPLNPWAEEQLKTFANPIYQTFGMTETVSHVALRRLSGDDASDYYHTLPEVKISGDSRGCLIIQGPMTNHNPVVTNDLVELIDEQHFHWMGRVDQVINSGGFKIYLQKVENIVKNLLQNQDYVGEFAIVGIPHTKLGQMAILVLEGPIWASNTQKDFLETLKQALHAYEVPKKIIFLDNFPHTSSGKIDYTKLTEAISEE